MAEDLRLRAHSQLARAGRSRFVTPVPRDEVERRLRAALRPRGIAGLVSHPFRREGERPTHDGEVHGRSFWVARRGSLLNPLERRLEGVLVPLGESTEVRVEARPRPGSAAVLITAAGMLAALTVLGLALALVAGSLPLVGDVAGPVLVALVAATWILAATAVFAARALAHGAEGRLADFLTAVLEAPADAL